VHDVDRQQAEQQALLDQVEVEANTNEEETNELLLQTEEDDNDDDSEDEEEKAVHQRSFPLRVKALL